MDKKTLILLTDDESEILDIYGSALTNAGFEVVTASNGIECLEVAAAKKPDLILLDLKMPVMDGSEVIMKLKLNPETKDIKVVFLTAFSDPMSVGVDERAAKEAGAAGFIKKGLGLNEFVEKAKGYLQG